MFRPLRLSHRQPPRRGTSFILIVVIMVALFAAIGTAYVLYAMQQAKVALYEKDAQGGGTIPPLQTPPDPTATVNAFFADLIYDVDYGNNNLAYLNNALRGHGIARSMYGYDASLINNTTTPQPATNPWNGVGLFQDTNSMGQRLQQVNHTIMVVGPNKYFLLDPEYMGERVIPAAGPIPPFDYNSRTYVGKNAGYSYPDLKDFFLGSVDPVTGQVLVPSFYRPWLMKQFLTQIAPTYNGPTLAQGSPIWTNPQGRLYSLRPWPTDHPNFPYPPPNSDGSVTGDVQNLPGGVGVQQNDSFWMNIGLPVITLPGGQKVQPLVAPLVLPLNGLFNLNAHGNVYYSGAQNSYAGYGPWEVNMGYVLPDAANIINGNAPNIGRGPYQQYIGTNSRAYAPYSAAPLPSYSPVAWNNTVIGSPIAYPTGNTISGLPTFTNLQSNNAAATTHPSLFNPTEWPDTPAGRTNRIFPLGDIKRLHAVYAGTPSWYQQGQVTQVATSLLGDQTNFPYVIPGQGTVDKYRLDPEHANRMLFTSRGYDLARPKLVPSFVNPGTTNAVQLTANANPTLYVPKLSYPSVSQYPTPTTPGTGSDFSADANTMNGAHRWSNALVALGAVDLNRPLADYRGNPGNGNTLSNDTGNMQRADYDRRKLAHDIFVRLAVATGAAGISISSMTGTEYPAYQYTITVTPAGNQTQFDTLRYLAQLAVNIVDYIDNDDISTVFVWNPVTTGGPNYATDPATDPNNFATAPIANSPAGQIGLSVVFGHEKTRLVINEAYSEITNDPATSPLPVPQAGGVPQPLPANSNAHVRFWLELLNPSSTLTPAAPANNPMGTGQVSLAAYQIEIRRETRQTGVAMGSTDTGAVGNNQYPYLFNNNSNPTGGFNQNQGAADIVLNLGTCNSTNNITVSPNNSNFNGGGGGNGANGMILLGPSINTSNSVEFFPDTTSAAWTPAPKGSAILIGGGVNAPSAAPGSPSMAYTMTMPQAQTLSSPEFRRHIILLRRLANPYAAASNTNPYVTVDLMDYVPSFDAVYVAADTAPSTARVSRPSANPKNDGSEYDPIAYSATGPASRFSVGKVQPYAGHAYAYVNPNTGANAYGQFNQYSFAGNVNGSTNATQASMVLNQVLPTNNNTTVTAGKTTTGQPGPMNTFGTHNSATSATTIPTGQTFVAGTPPSLTDPTTKNAQNNNNQTLMLPFDWLPQMDRPLVNEIELLSVRDTPPHRVTDQFLLGNTASPGVAYRFGAAPWLSDGYTRALEFLTVKSYVMGVPHGGRVPGKINVNVLRDQRVLFGLLDPQAGNNFNSGFVTGSAWSWMGSRQNSGVITSTRADGTGMPTTGAPGQSIFDANATGAYDRPFMPFGAPIAASGGIAYGSATGATNTVDQTILRRNSGTPYLYFNVNTGVASVPNGPTYMRAEAARKIMNNITTVNHQYVVFLTVGYFNVTGSVTVGPNNMTIPQLGSEAYLTAPGDMRQKFVAVVDMSNMALDPVNPTIAQPMNPGYQWQPFFTSLEQTAYANGTNATATLNIPYTTFVPYPSAASVNPLLSTVYVGADGQQVPISPGNPSLNPPLAQSTLVIGYGSEQQVVMVTGVNVPTGSQFAQVTVQTVSGQPFRTAWAGTCVSNVRPGYMGPQPNFDYTNPLYAPVLPYVERLK